MKIQIRCGKVLGPTVMLMGSRVCQGEILIEDPITQEMAYLMMEDFYSEHEHLSEEEPEDKDPEELPTNGMQIVQDPPTPFDLVEGPEGAEAHG